MAPRDHIEDRRVQWLDELAAETGFVTPGNNRLHRRKAGQRQIDTRALGDVVNAIDPKTRARQVLHFDLEARAPMLTQMRRDDHILAKCTATVKLR